MSSGAAHDARLQDPAAPDLSAGSNQRERNALIAVCLGVLALGLVASAAGWALRYAGIDVSNHGVRAAIETGGSLVSAVAGFLVWGRARRTASRADVLLAAILFVLAVVNLSVGLLPALVAPNAELFAGWTPDAARLIPAVGFVVAAVSGDRALDRPQRELLRVVVLGMLFLATVIAAGAALAEPATAARLVLTPTGRLVRDAAHSAAVAAVLGTVAAVLWASAATGFMMRARKRGDELTAWVAVGLALVAVARVDAIVFPDLWTADVLRVAALLAIVAGAVREIGAYQRAVAEAAVANERRRLARDLHDGLAQELAYLTAQSRRLASAHGNGEWSTYELVAAAERALEESRLAIAALRRPADEPLDESLEKAARSAGDRAGLEMTFDLRAGVQVAPEVREALLRVMLEAVGNAARHAGAREVKVELRAEDGLVMSVRDDGTGFDPAAPRRPDSLGLQSMCERVEALGGRLSIDTAPGTPTTVRVELP